MCIAPKLEIHLLLKQGNLSMSYFLKLSLIAPLSLAVLASEASAQFYTPGPAPQSHTQHPGGLGLDLGLRNGGFNPNAGVGIGQLGAGVGTGFGINGIGAGANAGVGPIGASVDAGLGRNGIGARAGAGIANTGAAFEAGLSGGGVGVGANAKVLGFGAGASLGVGKRGPGLGTSIAFGPLGTLLIGSHRNSYPGARQTAAFTRPNQNASYYTPQNYGNPSYYRSAPTQRPVYTQPTYVPHHGHYPQQRRSSCQAGWTC